MSATTSSVSHTNAADITAPSPIQITATNHSSIYHTNHRGITARTMPSVESAEMEAKRLFAAAAVGDVLSPNPWSSDSCERLAVICMAS